jgi:hypothetical protein
MQKKPRSSRITRKSWASANIAPPAKAWPPSAATVGSGKASMRPSMRWKEARKGPSTAGPWLRIHSRSSPFE